MDSDFLDGGSTLKTKHFNFCTHGITVNANYMLLKIILIHYRNAQNISLFKCKCVCIKIVSFVPKCVSICFLPCYA